MGITMLKLFGLLFIYALITGVFAGEINVLLTFDDGPAAAVNNDEAQSPTLKTLETLTNFTHGKNNEKRGVCAVFFILTAPDKFLYFTHRKGETVFGQKIIQEIDRRGHLIGVHWGGDYRGQTRTHLSGIRENTPLAEQMLTRQLQSSIDLITQLTNKRPEFIRPPLWIYRDKKNPALSALPIYEYLNLKMILTDAKYPDGGYKSISRLIPFKERLFTRSLQSAFLSGENNIIITFHDANTQTADNLPNALATIKRVYVEIFGTNNGLNFVDNATHAARILREKEIFVMFKQGVITIPFSPSTP